LISNANSKEQTEGKTDNIPQIITGYTLRSNMQNETIREQLGVQGTLGYVKAVDSSGREAAG
jgi:hypothetical protein